MCDPATVTAAAALLGAGASVATAAKAGQKPKKPQEAKKPDAGLSEDERRSRLLAQLAAGSSRNNPTGGLSGGPSTGNVVLGV